MAKRWQSGDQGAASEAQAKVARRSQEPWEEVARALVQVWADGADAAEAASALEAVSTLSDALHVHEALAAPPVASELGGLAGWKLGWKLW